MNTKKEKLVKKIIFFLALFSLTVFNSYSIEYQKLPSKIQAAFIVKILELNKTICDSKNEISIHVMNDIVLYQEFVKMIGMKINGKKLAQVTATEDDILPSYVPSVIYIGNTQNLKQILTFTQKEKILSITGNPGLITKNVSVSIMMLEGAPKVLLEINASKRENMNWDPKMMKISRIIE